MSRFRIFNIRVFLFVLLALFFSCNNGTLPVYFENTATDIAKIDILIPGDTGLKYNVSSIGFLQVKYSPDYQKMIETYEDEEIDITLEHIYNAIQSNLDGFFAEAEEKTGIQIIELSEAIEPENVNNWDEYKRISDSLNFDALIFINNIKITFKIETEIPENGLGEGFHESTLKCTSTFFYTVLYPEKGEFETISASFSDRFDGDRNFFGSLPAYLHSSKKINEVLPYICYETGKKAVYEIFPIWATVERKYYGRASKELRQAKKNVYKGMWDEAISIWENNKNHENRVIAKHCQFNLILAEEITGSIREAFLMAEKYYQKYNEEIALEYMKILARRVLQTKRIKKNNTMNNQ